MRERRPRQLSQRQAALLLLIPFLATYVLFLVYPFFRGVWISLHDWNLLAVAFNPDAKDFVGLRNYERVMWGSNIEWGFAAPLWQGLGLIGLALTAFLHRTGRVSRFNAIAMGVVSLLLVVLPGFHPGEGGRWYDRRFWPTVGNTMLFVGLTVPGVTISALLLAATALASVTLWALGGSTIGRFASRRPVRLALNCSLSLLLLFSAYQLSGLGQQF